VHGVIQVKGSVRRGEELKLYVELLRGKSTTYKALKKEVDDMATEYNVLVRTQQLLEQKVACNNDSTTAEYEVIQCIQRMLQQQANRIDTVAFESNELFKQMPTSNFKATNNEHQDLQPQSKKVWQKISKLDKKLQEKQAEVLSLTKQLKDVRAILHNIEVQHVEQQSHFIDLSLAYER
jgi:chromosome segregation ATPase